MPRGTDSPRMDRDRDRCAARSCGPVGRACEVRSDGRSAPASVRDPPAPVHLDSPALSTGRRPARALSTDLRPRRTIGSASATPGRAHCSDRAGPALLLAVCCVGLLLGSASAPAAAAPAAAAEPGGLAAGRHAGRGARVRPHPDHDYGPGHRGVDLAARTGEPVLAAAAGTVAFAGSVAGRGVVSIDHGAVRTTYEPVAAQVSAGQRVAAGQPIGRVAGGRPLRRPVPALGAAAGQPATSIRCSGRPVHAGPLRLLAAAHRERGGEQARARAAAAAEAGWAQSRRPPSARAAVTASCTRCRGRSPRPSACGSIRCCRGWKLHDGTDFGAGCGTPIRAPYAGTVTAAYFNAGYGNRLMLDHGRSTGRGADRATTTRPATWSGPASGSPAAS